MLIENAVNFGSIFFNILALNYQPNAKIYIFDRYRKLQENIGVAVVNVL